mmetsp:Transcript_46154/g.139871  ORF Transcript_46154/g.139871 Transcript_46154/m.139871 type:complete len:284 (+) Transcript_46154:782-1633(+)
MIPSSICTTMSCFHKWGVKIMIQTARSCLTLTRETCIFGAASRWQRMGSCIVPRRMPRQCWSSIQTCGRSPSCDSLYLLQLETTNGLALRAPPTAGYTVPRVACLTCLSSTPSTRRFPSFHARVAIGTSRLSSALSNPRGVVRSLRAGRGVALPRLKDEFSAHPIRQMRCSPSWCRARIIPACFDQGCISISWSCLTRATVSGATSAWSRPRPKSLRSCSPARSRKGETIRLACLWCPLQRRRGWWSTFILVASLKGPMSKSLLGLRTSSTYRYCWASAVKRC